MTNSFWYKLTFIIYLLCAFNGYAQKCNCPLFNDKQIKDLRRSKDSVGTIELIKQYNKQGSTDCLIRAFGIEIEYLVTFKQVKKVPLLLDQQEQLAQKSECKDEHLLQNYLFRSYYCKIEQDYEGLSKYSFAMLELAEKLKDTKLELQAIDFITFLFTRQNQKEKVWDWVKRAERILSKNIGSANNYNWLATQYEAKYVATKRITLLDSAMIFAKKAKELAASTNDNIEMMKVFRIYEANHSHRKEYKQAISYVDSSIFYQSKLKILADPSSFFLTKAINYSKLNDYKNAQFWMDSCLFYTEKFSSKTAGALNVYKVAAKLFEESSNLPKALSVYKLYDEIKDSVFTIQRTEKINELEQKYNKSQNEKIISDLALQKKIYLLLALAGLLGIAAIAFFLRQQSLKHKKNILETEQRLNRARMNPHFFFNALTALQKFALKENDGQAMASNLSKFSNIMRETLESTYKEYVTIEQEIEFLNEYLEVQKIRFPQTFSYEVSADKNLEIDELQIPAMIIQPFVENSIEHGFAGVDYPGNISINFTPENKDLLIEIKDNGKGLNTTVKENNEHISRASQIIKDRIYLLNIKLKTKAGFSIDNAAGGGVIVKIHLPLLYKESKNS